MFFKSQIITGIVVCLLFIQCSTKREDYQKDKSGLEYRFVTENQEAQQAVINDILEIKYKLTKENDSIIEETDLFRIRLGGASHPGGSIEDGLAMMHIGDSAVFLIDAESYYILSRGIQLPPYLKKGEKVKFHIKLQEIIDLKEFEAYRDGLEQIDDVVVIGVRY